MNRAPNGARPGKKQILHFKWRPWILKIRCKYKIIYDIINVTWRVKTRDSRQRKGTGSLTERIPSCPESGYPVVICGIHPWNTNPIKDDSGGQ